MPTPQKPSQVVHWCLESLLGKTPFSDLLWSHPSRRFCLTLVLIVLLGVKITAEWPVFHITKFVASFFLWSPIRVELFVLCEPVRRLPCRVPIKVLFGLLLWFRVEVALEPRAQLLPLKSLAIMNMSPRCLCAAYTFCAAVQFYLMQNILACGFLCHYFDDSFDILDIQALFPFPTFVPCNNFKNFQFHNRWCSVVWCQYP